MRGNHAEYDWRVSVYKTDVNDLIGFDFDTFLAGNTDSATLEGVELELTRQFNEWDFALNLNYLDARDDETNEYLDDRVVASANLQVGRRFESLYLGIDMQAEHGRHDRGGADLPGFAIWGISAVYDVTEQLKISGRVDNVFDQNYTINLATASSAFETDGLNGKLSVEYTF